MMHPTLLERYEPLLKLGEGGYAVVMSVRDRATSEIRVVKKINDAFSNACDAQRCFREVAFQRAASHPNILPLVSAAVSSTDLYLMCAPMAMDLSTALRHNLLPHRGQKQCVLFQLACALGYMHTCGVLHRDLKPANVLLDLDCTVKLCDFGLCRSTPSLGSGERSAPATPRALDESSEPAEGSISESVGSRWYRAPEVLLGARVYDASADMWSFGCIAGEMMCGKTLLLGASTPKQLVKILQVTVGALPTAEDLEAMNVPPERARQALELLPQSVFPTRLARLLPRVPPDGIDFVSSLLQLRPATRATYDAVIDHPYLASFVSEDGGARRRYAAASIGTESRFDAPLDDGHRLSAASYREFLEERLAERLDSAECDAPAVEGSAPGLSVEDCAC